MAGLSQGNNIVRSPERVLRPATPADAANLAALSVQVWLHTYAKRGLRNALSDYVLTEFTADRMAARLADEKQVFLVAEIDAHLVGYLRLALDAPCPGSLESRTEIGTLYVQEHFVGRGIGSALLEYAFAHCAASGVHDVWLTVNHENTNAIAFYERHRFHRRGSTFFHLENERHENFILARSTGASD